MPHVIVSDETAIIKDFTAQSFRTDLANSFHFPGGISTRSVHIFLMTLEYELCVSL